MALRKGVVLRVGQEEAKDINFFDPPASNVLPSHFFSHFFPPYFPHISLSFLSLDQPCGQSLYHVLVHVFCTYRLGAHRRVELGICSPIAIC
jgi:hypothetical protein